MRDLYFTHEEKKMLVLSRKNGQTIEIGGGITVQVIRIEGNRVRIGISAPKEVCVLRGELPPACEFSPEADIDLGLGVECDRFSTDMIPQAV